MARKPIYILHYDTNSTSRYGVHRCAAFSTFARAYNEMARDVDYLMGADGAHIDDEWYNANNIADATSARVILSFAEGNKLAINITPSYVN